MQGNKRSTKLSNLTLITAREVQHCTRKEIKMQGVFECVFWSNQIIKTAPSCTPGEFTAAKVLGVTRKVCFALETMEKDLHEFEIFSFYKCTKRGSFNGPLVSEPMFLNRFSSHYNLLQTLRSALQNMGSCSKKAEPQHANSKNARKHGTTKIAVITELWQYTGSWNCVATINPYNCSMTKDFHLLNSRVVKCPFQRPATILYIN